MSLNVKVKGQGHQGQKMCCALPSPPEVMEWNVVAANNVMQQQMGLSCRCRSFAGGDFGSLRAVYI